MKANDGEDMLIAVESNIMEQNMFCNIDDMHKGNENINATDCNNVAIRIR